MNATVWKADAPRLTRVRVLTPYESFECDYDGYGQGLGDEFDAAKLVLASNYEGESYAQLGSSGVELNQGCFFDKALVQSLLTLRALPSYSAYRQVVTGFESQAEQISLSLLRLNSFRGSDVQLLELIEYWDACAEHEGANSGTAPQLGPEEARHLQERVLPERQRLLKALAHQLVSLHGTSQAA